MRRPKLQLACFGLAAAAGGALLPAPQASDAPSARELLQEAIEEFIDITRLPESRTLRRSCRDIDSERCTRAMGNLGVIYHDVLDRARRLPREELQPRERIDLDLLEYRLEARTLAMLGSRYEAQLFRHTGENTSAEAIHQLGKREVERLRGEMDQLVQQQRAGSDLRAFLDAARSDPRLYAASRRQLVEESERILGIVRANLSRLFHQMPSAPYDVRTVDRMRDGVMAQYFAAGGRQRRAIIGLNPDPGQVPLFLLEPLMLHEGLPGHHFQVALAAETVGVSSWRRGTIPTAYVEGWGLYAESLGADLGLYRHAMWRFGRLNLEMWRAIRLVLDTGLHEYDWDLDTAVEYFLTNSALPESQARVEVRRYRDNPGQAVAYKIGQLRFLELRQRAEEALGERFDVRDYHRAALANGPVPLRSLEEAVDRWIKEELAG